MQVLNLTEISFALALRRSQSILNLDNLDGCHQGLHVNLLLVFIDETLSVFLEETNLVLNASKLLDELSNDGVSQFLPLSLLDEVVSFLFLWIYSL